MTPSGPSPEPPPEAGMEELVRRTQGLQPWRRFFHAMGGASMVAALQLLPVTRSAALGVLGTALVLLALGDLARLRHPRVNALFFQAFPSLASPREARKPASSTWYVLGVFLVLLLFPREQAVAGILVLALADPAASIVGRRWGTRSWGKGSPEGSSALLAVAFLVLLPMMGPGRALAGAACAAAVELIPWPLDDNLTLPLTVAGALWTLALI